MLLLSFFFLKNECHPYQGDVSEKQSINHLTPFFYKLYYGKAFKLALVNFSLLCNKRFFLGVILWNNSKPNNKTSSYQTTLLKCNLHFQALPVREFANL